VLHREAPEMGVGSSSSAKWVLLADLAPTCKIYEQEQFMLRVGSFEIRTECSQEACCTFLDTCRLNRKIDIGRG